MQFERKIAGAALKDPTPPAVEPTGEQKGGSLEIKGGTVSPKASPHKDWRHVIAHNFELRNNIRTMRTLNRDADEIAHEVDLDYAFTVLRAPDVEDAADSLSFSLKKPDGVPQDQGVEPGQGIVISETEEILTRGRSRVCDIQIYYPKATTLNFSSEFVFGNFGHKPRMWTLEELTALLPSSEEAPNPVIVGLTLGGGAGMPDFVRGLEERSLQEVLVPHQVEGFDPETWDGPLQRAAGTTDYLRFFYNERTGKCLVTALSVGVVGDADPDANPPEPPTIPNTDPTDTPPPRPWEPQNPGGPRLPSAVGDEYTYVDENGDPLVATPAPAGVGTVYALHTDGFSASQDGGRTWDLRVLSNPGPLVDIAAGPGGVYLLTADGKVWLGTGGNRGQFERLILTDATAGAEAEVALVNPGFELGDLTGWNLAAGDEPQVVDTATPPQRDGAFYLTRDWRILLAQDFAIQQTVDLPGPVVGETGKLRLYADALTERGDIAKIEILDGTETLVFAGDFAITRTGSNFRADGFATSPTQGPLNLVGTGTPTVGTFINEDLPIWLRGSIGQTVSGRIEWRVEKADGTLYDGNVALRIFDLDSPETLTVEGVVNYSLLTSLVTATELAADRVRFNGGADDGITTDVPGARIHVTVRPEFAFVMIGVTQAAFGLKGTGGAAPPAAVLASAQSDNGAWRRIMAEYNGALPPRVTVRLSGQAVGGYADVYIDNVSLTLPGFSEEVPAGAMAGVRLNHEGGGVDLFIGDTVVSRRTSYSPDQNAANTAGPGDGIALFATPGEALVSAGQGGKKTVANGTRVSVFPDVEWEDLTLPGGQAACSVLTEPVWCVTTPVGNLFRYNYVTATLDAPILVGPDGHLASDYKRKGAAVTSREGAIDFVGKTGSAVSWARQPVNDTTPARQSCCLDSGRYLGHPVGAYSLFWTDNPVEPNSWKYAGRLERPILKIVEMR